MAVIRQYVKYFFAISLDEIRRQDSEVNRWIESHKDEFANMNEAYAIKQITPYAQYVLITAVIYYAERPISS